jgi:hypothetical protein
MTVHDPWNTHEGAGFRYKSAHPTLYYVGSEPLTQRVVDTIAASLHDFAGPWGYLHDVNPIVFAAKPGTLAVIADDAGWAAALPLAPLAQKVRRLLAPSVGDVINSLDQLIDRLVDYRQGIGEIELAGSISWSDFSALDQAARPIDSASVRLPYFNADTAVIRRYLPGIGPIEGFYFNSREQRLVLVSQGNDWKIWSWGTSGHKRLIFGHLR